MSLCLVSHYRPYSHQGICTVQKFVWPQSTAYIYLVWLHYSVCSRSVKLIVSKPTCSLWPQHRSMDSTAIWVKLANVQKNHLGTCRIQTVKHNINQNDIVFLPSEKTLSPLHHGCNQNGCIVAPHKTNLDKYEKLSSRHVFLCHCKLYFPHPLR